MRKKFQVGETYWHYVPLESQWEGDEYDYSRLMEQNAFETFEEAQQALIDSLHQAQEKYLTGLFTGMIVGFVFCSLLSMIIK